MSDDSEFAMLQHALTIAEHSTRASSVEVILAAEVRRLEEKEAAVVDSLGKSVMEIKQLKAQLEEARKALREISECSQYLYFRYDSVGITQEKAHFHNCAVTAIKKAARSAIDAAREGGK